MDTPLRDFLQNDFTVIALFQKIIGTFPIDIYPRLFEASYSTFIGLQLIISAVGNGTTNKVSLLYYGSSINKCERSRCTSSSGVDTTSYFDTFIIETDLNYVAFVIKFNAMEKLMSLTPYYSLQLTKTLKKGELSQQKNAVPYYDAGDISAPTKFPPVGFINVQQNDDVGAKVVYVGIYEETLEDSEVELELTRVLK